MFEFQFPNGARIIPEGYDTPTSRKYSTIVLEFDTIQSGYDNSLAMGLPDGSEVGCAIKKDTTTDFKATFKKKIRCFLHIGTNQEDMP